MVNPFGVALTGQIRVSYPGGEIAKPVTIAAAGTSRVSIPFTGDELRAFLGTTPVLLSGFGTVSANAGAITVTPQQVVEIEAKIQLDVQIGA